MKMSPETFLKSVQERLRKGVSQLKRNIVGCKAWTIGCEDELAMVSTITGRIAHVAPEILNRLKFEPIAKESGTGMIEINLPPGRLDQGCLRKWEQERGRLLKLIQATNSQDAFPLMTGIPPSIVEDDISIERLTPDPRLMHLERKWLRAADAYKLRYGKLPMLCGWTADSTAVSNAIHACQLHISLPDDPFKAARIWNAVMLAAPLALSAFVGSPIFLGEPGHTEELRIEVWELLDDLKQGRVFFGPGFVDSIDEVLEHYVEKMPFLHLGEDLDSITDLDFLRRHVKNMWPWVRLIPDTDHWRIEIRCFAALPPKSETMLSYVTYGLVSLFEKMDVRSTIDFAKCSKNFRGAANQGLNSFMRWKGGSMYNAATLLKELMPQVRSELEALGSPMPQAYYEEFLGQLEQKMTPARKLRLLRRSLLGQGLTKTELCRQMTLKMIEQQKAELTEMGF